MCRARHIGYVIGEGAVVDGSGSRWCTRIGGRGSRRPAMPRRAGLKPAGRGLDAERRQHRVVEGCRAGQNVGADGRVAEHPESPSSAARGGHDAQPPLRPRWACHTACAVRVPVFPNRVFAQRTPLRSLRVPSATERGTVPGSRRRCRERRWRLSLGCHAVQRAPTLRENRRAARTRRRAAAMGASAVCSTAGRGSRPMRSAPPTNSRTASCASSTSGTRAATPSTSAWPRR
jgi:hypothetical protein